MKTIIVVSNMKEKLTIEKALDAFNNTLGELLNAGPLAGYIPDASTSLILNNVEIKIDESQDATLYNELLSLHDLPSDITEFCEVLKQMEVEWTFEENQISISETNIIIEFDLFGDFLSLNCSGSEYQNHNKDGAIEYLKSIF